MFSLFKTGLNKRDYNIVFWPKTMVKGKRKGAHAVSINQLANYIGQTNANKAITAALSLSADSYRLMYRKFGTVYIYLK